MNRHATLVLGLAILVRCHDGEPTGAPPGAANRPDFSRRLAGHDERDITVMTRNLYIGADVDAVIGALASPEQDDDVPALVAAIGVLQQTDFPTRVEALADEIARTRPHVVGLQEVDRLQIDLAALGLPVIDLDFLPLLQAALAARGLHYTVAGQVSNLTAAPRPGIALTDHDAILVDADRVSVGASVTARTFSVNVGRVAPGVELKRGWVAIDATIAGTSIRIANTHLESGNAPGLATLRGAQAAELVASLVTASPAILLGDLNDTPGSPMYHVVTGSGFTDSWAALRPHAPGFTCCHLADLSNRVPRLRQRIDYVFARDLTGAGEKLRATITTVGDRPGDRVPGPSHPIWPSDHAGVVASFVPRTHAARN